MNSGTSIDIEYINASTTVEISMNSGTHRGFLLLDCIYDSRNFNELGNTRRPKEATKSTTVEISMNSGTHDFIGIVRELNCNQQITG